MKEIAGDKLIEATKPVKLNEIAKIYTRKLIVRSEQIEIIKIRSS